MMSSPMGAGAWVATGAASALLSPKGVEVGLKITPRVGVGSAAAGAAELPESLPVELLGALDAPPVSGGAGGAAGSAEPPQATVSKSVTNKVVESTNFGDRNQW